MIVCVCVCLCLCLSIQAADAPHLPVLNFYMHGLFCSVMFSALLSSPNIFCSTLVLYFITFWIQRRKSKQSEVLQSICLYFERTIIKFQETCALMIGVRDVSCISYGYQSIGRIIRCIVMSTQCHCFLQINFIKFHRLIFSTVSVLHTRGVIYRHSVEFFCCWPQFEPPWHKSGKTVFMPSNQSVYQQ